MTGANVPSVNPSSERRNTLKPGTMDQAEGIFHQMKGTLKEVAAKLGENPKLLTEGKDETKRRKETPMKYLVLVGLFVACTLTACMVSPGPPGYGGGVTVSPLPAVVVLDAEPYYHQNDYYYFYQNNSWRYSRSRGGPWADLPRSHWPKEVRYKDRDDRQDRGRSDDRRRNDRQEHERR